MLVFMLWALTPSDCWPTTGGPAEQARVVEIPRPVMSVMPEGGYFTFNHGRPFLAERDPLTGAIDSNLKTTPVTSDDYLYEEYEESGETIDRKDSTKIYTRNDIASPSKESDLHKFLNLPVHYSSSGKFPLISSSYANTKVQGHGPLSNHKLHSSSTSTTSSVSPFYYSLKTTPAATTKPTLTTEALPTTTTTTTSTTAAPRPSTSITTRASTTFQTTKAPSTVTTPKIIKLKTSTTTIKPLFSNYEYEYDYDYDKSDAEGTENSSQDYEFLGASSEVTKTQDKYSTINPVKQSTTFFTVTGTSKESTTKLSTDVPLSTTTSKTTTSFEVIPTTKTEIKPSKTTENINQLISTKKPVGDNASSNHEETVDLRPPKPVLSIELRPPQHHPTRPFSSVVPMKHQNVGNPGLVRYPETPLIVEDKKPISVYSPENSLRIKQESGSTLTQQTKLNIQLQDDQQNSSMQSKPSQNTSSNKNIAEQSIVLAVSTQDNNKHKTNLESDSSKESSTLHETYAGKRPEKPQGAYNIDKTKPQESSVAQHIVSVISPVETLKRPEDITGKPDESSLLNLKKPDFVSSEVERKEQITEHNKHQNIKPGNIRPQGVSYEQTKFQTGSNRPPQEYRPHIQIQGHAKPLISSQEYNKPQGVSATDNIMTQRPLSTTTENSRLQVNLKPDKRPPSSLISHNKQPHEHVHYSLEHSRPLNYQGQDLNRPLNPIFGLRVTDRPHGVPERPSGLEYLRPPGVRIPEGKPHDQKKPVNNIELRPSSQGVHGGEIRPAHNSPEVRPRPEANTNPLIFSKPQLGKRPDYNTVQFGQPSKIENHFISVSPGQENPSYSLQTSFSIGVPPPEQKPPPSSGVHGVGQVLFPDEEPEKRPPVWQHQRPPQVSHSETHPNIQVDKYPRPPWETHLKPPHLYHKKEPFPPIKRKPLPNILPQFRPNAKIGHAEPHIYLKPREPYDTLQPPPLPRPQFLRLEQEIEETKPLVHRRNGQTSRVTTLQMMQGTPTSKRAALRIEDSNENEPVFVVYPSNGNNAPSPPSDGVVVGTRGPQRPLPPDNLDIGDDLDSFPLDNNKNFQARVDTPVLKSKPSTSKPIIKNEFPYALIKPNQEEQNTPGSEVSKEYTAFSPTVTSIEKDHDTEINIIPYLQDYMPFATKKPQHKDTWILGTEIKHAPATVGAKPASIEMTPAPYKNDNHRVVNEGPQPQDFQAPFHASLTAPSQGWSVVQKKPNKEKSSEESTTAKDLNEEQTTEEPKFDIQNFKPQLFGGFKPIVPPADTENKEKVHH